MSAVRPSFRAASAFAASALIATLGIARAQSVPTHVIAGGAPIRIDDAYVTYTYACVSFTNTAARTANAVDFAVKFILPDGLNPAFTFSRAGSFATGVPIQGPAQGDQHASSSKLANCAALDVPDDAVDIQFFVTHVGFEDGSEWNLAPPKQ